MYNSFIDSENKEPWILPQNQNHNSICPVVTKMDKFLSLTFSRSVAFVIPHKCA